MKQIAIILIITFLGIVMVGCSKEVKIPEKTTLEKLNSEDINEQFMGLQEAYNKYGEVK